MDDANYFDLRNVDLGSYSEFKFPEYLKIILKDKNSRILDFGCGFGQLISVLLLDGFKEVEGADINSMAIASLRDRKINVHDISCDVDFYSKNAEKFDYVIMSHVLEHIPKIEIISLLVSIKNLLKPGGYLIVMVPNAQSNTGCYWAYEDFTHTLLFTAGSLYYVLKAAKFSNVSFLDVDCLAGSTGFKKFIKKSLLSLYKFNFNFWNKVTSSSFHEPSPQIFSYELKAIAQKK